MEGRKMLILKEIVDRYIKLGEPVSSAMLLEEHNLGVSSATIRNDMKYLEEQGYIEKPYSSSGRIPTQKGYRFFVDWLLEVSELIKREGFEIVEFYEFQRHSLDDLLRRTAFLLANATGWVGFVLSPKLEKAKVEYITLVKLDPKNVIVIVVTDLGTIESRIVQAKVSEGELEEMNKFLNTLCGRRLNELKEEIINTVESEGWMDGVIRDSLLILRDVIETIGGGIDVGGRRLYVEGVLNLLKLIFPEDGVDEARRIMAFLEDKEKFIQVVERCKGEKVTASIGYENPTAELYNYSLITMGYGYSGILGVLGPIRMDYSRAVSTTNYIGNRLKTVLSSSY
jgi:heat-inducible transcriptional repressor